MGGAVLGHANLQVTFAFSQVRRANTLVTTFGLKESFEWQNGSLVWKFSRNATNTTIRDHGFGYQASQRRELILLKIDEGRIDWGELTNRGSIV